VKIQHRKQRASLVLSMSGVPERKSICETLTRYPLLSEMAAISINMFARRRYSFQLLHAINYSTCFGFSLSLVCVFIWSLYLHMYYLFTCWFYCAFACLIVYLQLLVFVCLFVCVLLVCPNIQTLLACGWPILSDGTCWLRVPSGDSKINCATFKFYPTYASRDAQTGFVINVVICSLVYFYFEFWTKWLW